MSRECLGIALEEAIRRLEFSASRYVAPRWNIDPPPPIETAEKDPAVHIFDHTAREIINAVATAYDVSPWAILSRKKPNSIVRPRFAVYRLLKVHLGYSQPQIARATHRKDHSTVHHGLERATFLLATDPEWAERYHAAERLLGIAQ